MSKFDELKKLAEAATPGIWTAEPPAEDYERYGGEQYHWSVRCPSKSPVISYQLCKLSSLNNNEEEDAKFIAAANPAAILELLSIQAQLVKALKELSAMYGNTWDSVDGSLVMLSDGVPRFESAHAAAVAALAAAGAQP